MYGDPDPLSAGTTGEAALWGGSIVAMGMAANPLGAHQAGEFSLANADGFHQEQFRRAAAWSGRWHARSEALDNGPGP